MAMKMILHYERQEDGENILPLQWEIVDLSMGIPHSWQNEQPIQGTLQLQYLCAPENAQVQSRLQNAVLFGGWNIDFTNIETVEKNISWWMSLPETPLPVQELSIVLLHEFETLADAFRFLDFYKTGSLTVQTCQERFQSLGVSPKLMEKVKICFRFFRSYK